MSRETLTLKDFEDAVNAAIAQLYIMYKHNGGNEAHRLTVLLLKNANSFSPYIEELVATCLLASDQVDNHLNNALLVKIQPLVEAIEKDKS